MECTHPQCVRMTEPAWCLHTGGPPLPSEFSLLRRQYRSRLSPGLAIRIPRRRSLCERMLSMVERRKAQRMKTLKTGAVSFGVVAIVDCAIRNMSTDGRLSRISVPADPAEGFLHGHQAGIYPSLLSRCVAVRRRGSALSSRAGAEGFVGTATRRDRHATLRRLLSIVHRSLKKDAAGSWGESRPPRARSGTGRGGDVTGIAFR